jgi:hypothetical protein
LRRRGDNRANTHPRQSDAEQRPHESKNQALGQEEANDPGSTRAERQADRNFLLP